MSDNFLPQTEPLETDSKASQQGLRRRMLKFLPFKPSRSYFRKQRQAISSSVLLVGSLALTAAIVTAKNPTIVQMWERNLQTFFFDVRGPLAPPQPEGTPAGRPGIIILTMDGETMTQGTQIYPADPKQYAYFEPIQQWPWQRSAYAIVIDRLMQAGARAVVLDVVLDAPSSYGPEDDAELLRILKKYPGRVTLAEKYIEEESRTGFETKLLSPNPVFQAAAPVTGHINFMISPNSRIHKLGNEYLERLRQTHNDFGLSLPRTMTLAEAALRSAQVAYPVNTGRDIFFYGPSRTFEQVSFWHVLDPQNWDEYHLENQTFKDKIVLIGPTGGGESFQDFHFAPFSGTLRYPEKMAGVEIQANAIATLMNGKAISPLFADPWLQGVFVGVLVLGAGYLQGRTNRSLRRFGYGVVIAGGFCILSFGVFVVSRVVVPTTVPMIAIASCSLFYLIKGIIDAIRDFRMLSKSSEVQSSMSEFESSDLKDSIARLQQEFIGRTLDRRYEILEQIGIGGFGETYKARDLKQPSHPLCVIKRLRPANKSPKVIRLATDLFRREAVVLEQLGKYPQIPQLFTYFQENDEFYLAQEYIDGISLAEELKLHRLLRPISEQTVVMILHELLQILDFVHGQGVIHRDVKPANVIRRRSDRKLVLIDFGAVKQVTNLEEQADGTVLTVAIGTKGYTAPEQLMGQPCPASDIYSLGMTGIRALTGIEPSKLDSGQGEPMQRVDWKEGIQISHSLEAILDKMVKVDTADRYQSAQAVLDVLSPLVEFAQKTDHTPEFLTVSTADHEDTDLSTSDETKRWFDGVSAAHLPATDPEQQSNDCPEDATMPWTSPYAPLPPTDSEGNTAPK